MNWVVRQCNRAKLATEVHVATDSEEVAEALSAETCCVHQTDPTHQSGSDRVAEVAEKLQHEFIINVQGDEPFVSPTDIDAVIGALGEFGHDIVTLRTSATDSDVQDPNAVKIALGEKDRALIFLAPIPFQHPATKHDPNIYWRHIGLYGYRRSAC